MSKRGLRPLIGITLVSVIAFSAVVIAGYKPNLGLDLQGGVSVVLQPVEGGKKLTNIKADSLEQTLRVIEQRVNAIGVGEPDITVQGSTIVVQLPGIKDQKGALELVGKTAELRFRPVMAAPTSAPPDDAEEQIADLRKELKIPDGVTAAQIFADEQTKQEAINPSPTTTVPGAVPGSTAAPSTVAPTTAPPTTAAPSGDGTGGKSSAKVARIRNQTGTTVPPTTVPPTTAPTAGATTTVPGGVTTTTVFKPLNQYGIDVSAEKFAELYQLENAVTAADQKVTEPEDDAADKAVVLLGVKDKTGERLKYQLGPTMLTGRAIEDASAGLSNGQWIVNPVFKSGKDGIDLFNAAAAKCNAGATECPATTTNSDTGGQIGALAVVLDGTVLSAPGIQASTFSRDQIRISGSFDEKSANDLALALRYGSLPIELEPQQVQTVSATLGTGALRAGLISGMVGLGLVMIYMLFYYRLLGAITIGSLVLSGMMLWAVIGALGHYQGLSLSLAGIVGIIVSIGVSLDSSIVYFENLKEDVVNGRSLRSVVGRSFDQAFGTIVKADVSSLIGAVILYLLSVGPVKGFAFYLGLSTILDLVLAYWFIRPATVLASRSKLGLRPALFGIPVPAMSADVPTDKLVKPVATRPSATESDVSSGADDEVDLDSDLATDTDSLPEPEPDSLPEPEPDPNPDSEVASDIDSEEGDR